MDGIGKQRGQREREDADNVGLSFSFFFISEDTLLAEGRVVKAAMDFLVN